MLDGTGVYVTPHMLRHTFATQLLNAGCKVTTIQALLGHRRLNSTMIYAKVHDDTVAKDYFTAMAAIETKLENILPKTKIEETTTEPSTPDTTQWLKWLDHLESDPLTNQQLSLLSQLQAEITQLARQNKTSAHDQIDPIQAFFVNEQPHPVEQALAHPPP